MHHASFLIDVVLQLHSVVRKTWPQAPAAFAFGAAPVLGRGKAWGVEELSADLMSSSSEAGLQKSGVAVLTRCGVVETLDHWH